jgi:superfamily II DNA or RNA helicase
MLEFRPYQNLNTAQIAEQFRTVRSVLYQAGTGSGKTIVANGIMQKAKAKGNNCWFLAHRRELIEQTVHKLWRDCGEAAGVIMAGYRANLHMPIQVGSIDTLRSRLIKNDKIKITKPPKLIIIDEAHRSLAPTYMALLQMFPDAYLLGLTATPIRSDGRGLGHMYSSMVQAPSVAELIEMGYLVQPRYFTGATADMEGVKLQNYDYAQGEREVRMNRAQLRGDVVEQWLRHGERRKTIVFASGVKHSMALRDDFEAAGVRAAHIDGKTPTAERRKLFDEYRHTDKWEVLTNCMVATEGLDVPEVGCISLACPTKIISKYIQMGGRGLRTHDGKKDCIIIDHANSVLTHGFLEDPVPWSLGTEGRITDRIPEVREHMERQFECEQCGCIFAGQVRCPECGTRLEAHGQHELISTAEELIEITRGMAGAEAASEQKTYTNDQMRHFCAQLKGYASGMNPQKRTMKKGWIAHTFRAKFGVWPDGFDGWPPEEPTPFVLAFIRAKNAAYNIRRRLNAAQN